MVSQLAGLAVIVPIVCARAVGPPPVGLLLVGIGSGALAAGGFSALYALLAKGNIAQIAPVLGTSMLVPVAVGLLSGDRISAVQAAGCAAAVTGVMLITALERPGEKGDRAAGRTLMALAVVTAVALGITLVGTATVADHDAYWVRAAGARHGSHGLASRRLSTR